MIGAFALTAVMIGGACSASTAVKPGAVVTSTTAAPTTAVTEPTTTEASVAATTVAPTTTTTLSPAVIAENEVRAAWKRITDFGEACYAEPTAPCAVETVSIEPFASALTTRISNDYVALGRHVEVNESDPTYHTIGPVTFSDDGQTAAFESCVWSTSILVQNDPVAVVNDLKTTYRSTVRLRRIDGIWFAYQFRTIGSPVVGRNDCGPRQ